MNYHYNIQGEYIVINNVINNVIKKPVKESFEESFEESFVKLSDIIGQNRYNVVTVKPTNYTTALARKYYDYNANYLRDYNKVKQETPS